MFQMAALSLNRIPMTRLFETFYHDVQSVPLQRVSNLNPIQESVNSG